MPNCIKDASKSYKGNEPSPKGLGYCAHSEDIGTIKKGKDGNKWIIASTSSGIKRWIKYSKEIKKKYIGYKTYFTHYDSDNRYLVYIKNNDVIVYKKNNNYSNYTDYTNYTKYTNYTNLVKTYKAKKIFISKNPLIVQNIPILLLLSNNTYVYISYYINKFKINDKIEKIYSYHLKRSNSPNQIAFSKKNVYFFEFPTGYLPISEFPKFNKINDLDKIIDKGFELHPFLIPFENNKIITVDELTLEEFKEIRNKPLKEITLEQLKKIAKMYSFSVKGSKQNIVDTIERVRGIIVYKKEDNKSIMNKIFNVFR